MALGKRRQKQTSLWVEASQLQARGRHPFYSRVNEILDEAKFDTYTERIYRKYYAKTMGRPSIAPGVYFRCFLMGYFEGIASERGIAEEFSTASPVSLYGSTKLASEVLATEYGAAFGFPVRINRCGVLAGAGQDVVLLDRARFPRPKACAEYLSPEATRILDRLGLPARIDR